MPAFPREFQAVLFSYVRQFRRRVFAHVQLLLLGAILAPGKRTVTAVLRIVGLGRAGGMAPAPPGLEPGQVERPRRQPPATGPTRGPLSAGGSAGLRPGRNPGAPLGATHRRPGY